LLAKRPSPMRYKVSSRRPCECALKRIPVPRHPPLSRCKFSAANQRATWPQLRLECVGDDPSAHSHATQARSSLKARRRPAARACAPARRAQDDWPGPLDDLPLDRQRLVPTAGAPGPACSRLALVGSGSLDPLAYDRAALTAPRAGSRAGAARRQRILEPARSPATLAGSGCKLQSDQPPSPSGGEDALHLDPAPHVSAPNPDRDASSGSANAPARAVRAAAASPAACSAPPAASARS
jgi:hypothetical protein